MPLVLVGLGVGLAALVALAVLVWRKVPTLMTLDPGKLPKVQTDQRKRKILEARVERQLKQAEAAVTALARPLAKSARVWVSGAVDRMHKTATRTPSTAPTPTIESALTVSELLARCIEQSRSGKWADLEASCLSVIRLDPRNLDAYRMLGQSYLERDQHAEAREVFQYLEGRGAADPSVYDALGTIAVQSGKRDQAEAAYARSIAMEPDEPEHRLSLAEARLVFNDAIGAFEAAADALRLASSNPRVIDHYIRVALAANKPGFAEDGIAKLEAANPENAKIKEYRAELSQEVGKLPKRRRR